VVLAEFGGRQPAEAVVRYLGVVIGQPPTRLFAHFSEVAEDLHIQHATSEAAIEAFDEAALHRPSWLDEIQRDVLALGPFRQRKGDEFGVVVQAKLCGMATPQFAPKCERPV